MSTASRPRLQRTEWTMGGGLPVIAGVIAFLTLLPLLTVVLFSHLRVPMVRSIQPLSGRTNTVSRLLNEQNAALIRFRMTGDQEALEVFAQQRDVLSQTLRSFPQLAQPLGYTTQRAATDVVDLVSRWEAQVASLLAEPGPVSPETWLTTSAALADAATAMATLEYRLDLERRQYAVRADRIHGVAAGLALLGGLLGLSVGVYTMRNARALSELRRRLARETAQTRKALAQEQQARMEIESLSQELERQRESLDTIFINVPMAICLLEAESLRVLRANPTLNGFCDVNSISKLEGQPFLEWIHPAAAESLRRLLDTVRGEGRPVRFSDMALTCSEGPSYWTGAIIPLPRDGGVLRLLLAMVETTERVRAMRAMEQASEEKDQFLAMLSHEMRTPLTPIVASMEILHRLEIPDARARRAVDAAERSVRVLSRLINDLLDLSRISRGKLQLEKEPLDLNRVAAEALESMQEDAQAKGVRLRLQPAHTEVRVHGDPTRLHQVLTNLLNNAIKFTGPEGEVRLEVSCTERRARVRVEDTGIGMPPEMIPRLFVLFSQGPAAPEGRRGMGIGLALVKSLTELHGGSVSAYSAGPGQGSCFTVEIPLLSTERQAP